MGVVIVLTSLNCEDEYYVVQKLVFSSIPFHGIRVPERLNSCSEDYLVYMK